MSLLGRLKQYGLLSPASFVAGNNTIAVEVHLRIEYIEADMSFDMQLLGKSTDAGTHSLYGRSQPAFLFYGTFFLPGSTGVLVRCGRANTGWITGENCQLEIARGHRGYTTITST